MLFRKKMPQNCLYCLHSTTANESQVHCAKRGIRSADAPCWRFKYDPIKRIPPRPKAPNFAAYEQDDFSL